MQSSQNLNLASSQLSIAGSPNLAAQGTAAQPIILGRVLLNSGEVFFLGKRFEIDSGTISFSNPVRTDPIVNLQVKTTVERYNITASVTGPVDRLKTTYTSDPALPTGDIINLLAFGQTTAESASNAATPASVGAESAVAGAVGGQVASQMQKLTGISQLTLNPLAGNQNPGSQVDSGGLCNVPLLARTSRPPKTKASRSNIRRSATSPSRSSATKMAGMASTSATIKSSSVPTAICPTRNLTINHSVRNRSERAANAQRARN